MCCAVRPSKLHRLGYMERKILMRRESKTIFNVMLWKQVSYGAGSDFGETNTPKGLDFVPNAGIYIRAMTLWTISCPQGEKRKRKEGRGRQGKARQGGAANRTGARGHVCASPLNNSICRG